MPLPFCLRYLSPPGFFAILNAESEVPSVEQMKPIRPRNWLYEFLVCLELFLIVAIWRPFCDSWKIAFIFGGTTYITLAWVLRLTLQRHHRQGMKLMRRKEYGKAAEAFRNSHDFFAAHPWIDKYRFVTMFSSNAIPFQQMALNNLGICYLYMGEDAKALDAFQNLAALNCDYPYITKTIGAIQKHMEETAGQAPVVP